MRLRRTRLFVSGLCAALVLPASAAADPGPYVALGDSYTSATFVLNQTGRPAGCARSDHNYPTLVAIASGVGEFTDTSCSSAQTKDMTGAQAVPFGVHEPQFNALHASTRLVTVGIGGNDAGVFGAIIKCVNLGLLAPTGSACRRHFVAAGDDSLATAIADTAPKIAAVLAGIHERSPRARIALVGYPAVLPAGNGCYPIVPLSPDDVRYLDGVMVRLNAMLAEQAAANGAEFVDTYRDSIGHDVCAAVGAKWFEGLVPTAVAFPVHPNVLGTRGMAGSVLRVLSRPRPAPMLSGLARVRRATVRGRRASFLYRLDRHASVGAVLSRMAAGRRWVVVRRLSFAGAFGDNVLALSAADYHRRVGLYRLTLTPSDDELAGAPQVVRFRIKR